MVSRWAACFVFWLVIGPTGTVDLLVGALTAAGAAWASLLLLPPGSHRLQLVALVKLAVRFVVQSAVAGTDVARRALAPSLPLHPGFVRVPLRIAPGTTCDAFCAFASLLPGTLPVGGDHDGALQVHCLDCEQDVRAPIGAEEAAFLAVLGRVTDG